MLRIMMKPGGPPVQPGAPPQAPQLPPDPTANPDVKDHADGGGPGQTSQQIAGYMGPDKGPFECEHCKHFQDPGSCDIVAGKIDPEGCCNLFEPDPNRRPDNDNDEDQDEGPGLPDVASLLQGH